MKKMSFKILCCVVFTCICGVTTYVYVQYPQADRATVSSTKEISVSNQPLTVVQHVTENEKNSTNSNEMVDQSSYVLISLSELAEAELWLKDKGYFSKADVDIYDSYSDDSLREMAKNGDLIASNVLSTRFVTSGNEKEATFYMNLSVLYGSTAALDNLTIYTSPRPPFDKTEQDRKPAALETLALINVIAKRGDLTLSQVSRDSFLKSYKRLYGEELQLTSEENQAISERSQVIYEAFQEVRVKKGLGEFDNSEPDSVKKFFGMQ